MAFVAEGRVIAEGPRREVLDSADPRVVAFRG
jgi:hypothetical protein